MRGFLFNFETDPIQVNSSKKVPNHVSQDFQKLHLIMRTMTGLRFETLQM